MFDRILIANRGEIACRIMATAQKLGVACVAVYSDADRSARHVRLADRAVHIGGAAPAESYLRGDRIIQAALETGAQAIHPGYGFLSENPDFVQAVSEAGLVFIGPDADAIRAMGLKDAAKALMEKAGVPVVPGYHGADQTALAAQAERVGYPLLIKAVAGGGGKGMRLVERAEDFAAALESAQGEARTAFGNDAVLLEKFVTKPRHIEVQIFGDGAQAVHLFERDCSLQRRHQKVIEEAPAPGMTKEMRDAMGAAAVRAAQAIGYKGAGTVEFIVDGSEGLRPDRFFFMEMNTRLQVEHPVTEMITGVDLVEWQLRVAAGEALPAAQEALGISGHAFEARLYAEDVPAGFLPATGRIGHLAFPSTVRADVGVQTGDEISPFYDPMIAKVIVHGPTRAAALAQLRRGLEETQIAGTVTNLSFLRALAGHAGFGAGDVDTGLIARDLEDLVRVPEPSAHHWVCAAMAAVEIETLGPDQGFSLWAPLAQSVHLERDGAVHSLTWRILDRDRHEWDLDGQTLLAERIEGRWWIEGRPVPKAVKDGPTITVFAQMGLVFHMVDPLARGAAQGASSDVVEAPMPGLVKAVFVSAGATVEEGARLAVLEAMKMEHVLLAPRDGVVAELLAQAGDQVEAKAALVRLEPEVSQGEASGGKP